MIQLLDTDAALAALGPEWDALWRETPGATPFQSPLWLLPWWRQFGTGLPRVATMRRDGRLCGVLPLYILPGERKALPIGAGTTDYLDALGDPAPLLLLALDRLRGEPVDSLDLIELPPQSGLTALAVPGWAAERGAGSACPVLTLPELPYSARRKLRMNRNRAVRCGGWAVETATAATLGTAWSTLARLHQARWTALGEPGVLADPAVLAFWEDAAPPLLEAGMLRLQLLHVGGVPAAAALALLAPERLFLYLSGFDAAQSYVSPGSLLVGAMIEEAIAEGRREIHFLRGQEGYKYAWGAVDRPNHSVRFTPRSSVDST